MDLTHGIQELRRSVAVNKHNIRARNLLGFALFEIGHVGDALKHWVISQSRLDSNENPAVRYIQIAQESGRTLERLSDAVGMYNQSLEYIRQKSDDLAIIQLKKAIEINPKFINALNLLALCYLVQDDREKASRAVDRVLTLDVHNTIALHYYNELFPNRVRTTGSEPRSRRAAAPPQATVAPPPSINYTRLPAQGKKSTNFHIAEILSFIIGAVCMFAALYVLIYPAIQKENDRRLDEASQRIAENTQASEERINRLTNDLNESDQLINELRNELTNSNANFDAQERTNRVLNAHNLLIEGRLQEAVDMLNGVSTNGLASDIIEKAEEIPLQAYPLLARQYYDDGVAADRVQDYAKALVDFEKSLRYIDEEADYYRNLIYYLAWQYAQNESTLLQSLDYLHYLTAEHPNFNTRDVNRLLQDVEAAVNG
jgi:tetratricopeptide (TPR) repeat protein